MLARTVFFVLLGLSVALFSCSKDRPAPAAPAGKSLASLAAPAAPTNLRFDAPTDSSCTVRWDASDGATDYDVNYKPAVGGRWTNEPHRGIGLSNTIHDLQPNTEYRWAVRAENSDGTSEWVFGPNFTTEASEDDGLNGAPPAPTNLRIDQLTATSVRILWDASDGATDYDVNYKAVGGRWTNEPHRGTQLYNTIGDLEPNTEYQWAVRAENSAGTSTWVHADNFTTLADSVTTSDGASDSPAANISVATPAELLADSLALVSFYRATNGDEWDDNSGWLSSQPFREWHGVRVDAAGRVERLTLGDNGLTRSIPSELGYLSKLRDLSLDHNELTGSIPSALGQLSQLERLELRHNGLTGSIPPELGQLSQLERLNLAVNELTGSIPSELGNLSKLYDLGLDQNELTGSIPPELGNLFELGYLWLRANELTGSIPPELGNLSKLRDLFLGDNELTGGIPSALGQLSQLERLSLNHNGLTGSIPAELGNLSELVDLWLHDNGLTGSIPADLGQLSQLERLELRHNGLTGSIPAGLGNLSKLRGLYLSSNSLTGSIPAELGNLSKLRDLFLDHNELTGSIPADLGQLSRLERLYLHSNELTGCTPRTCSLCLSFHRTCPSANRKGTGRPATG